MHATHEGELAHAAELTDRTGVDAAAIAVPDSLTPRGNPRAAGLFGVNLTAIALLLERFWNLQFSIISVAPPVTRMKGALGSIKVRLRSLTTCEFVPVRVITALPEPVSFAGADRAAG